MTRRMGHVALLVALAVVPVLALNSLATADTGTDPRPGPTDTQRACLAQQGVALPAPASPGEPPAALTKEQRQALRRGAKVCGLRTRLALRHITDAQRQCVADQGVTLPDPSTGGRSKLSPAQRQALRQAGFACALQGRHPHDKV